MSDTKEYDLIYMNFKMGEKSVIVQISRLAGEINCKESAQGKFPEGVRITQVYTFVKTSNCTLIICFV